jgi:hypothetical protein
VVAIDLGTSRSGYAYSFNDPAKIITNLFEYNGCYFSHSLILSFLISHFSFLILSSYLESTDKVFTCILLQEHNGKLEFKAFGNEANDKMYILNEEDHAVYGFKYFKMSLFNETTTIAAHNGAQIPLVDVISYSIKVWVLSPVHSTFFQTNSKKKKKKKEKKQKTKIKNKKTIFSRLGNEEN